MNMNTKQATEILIKNFLMNDAQPMEDITQAFEYLNESTDAKAYIGNEMLVAMLKLSVARLSTQKLILLGELH